MAAKLWEHRHIWIHLDTFGFLVQVAKGAWCLDVAKWVKVAGFKGEGEVIWVDGSAT